MGNSIYKSTQLIVLVCKLDECFVELPAIIQSGISTYVKNNNT